MKAIAIIAVMFVLAASFVIADNETNDTFGPKGFGARFGNVSIDKNMTYGLCVNEFAKAKNACYTDVKQVREQCRLVAQNSTNASEDARVCGQQYKQAKGDCKKGYKDSKNTCMNHKKTFGDKARFWK